MMQWLEFLLHAASSSGYKLKPFSDKTGIFKIYIENLIILVGDKFSFTILKLFKLDNVTDDKYALDCNLNNFKI